MNSEVELRTKTRSGDRGRAVVAGWMVLTSSYIVLSSLYVLSVASWTVLAFDQWRIYDGYFAQEFPGNVLAEQNGHRPVVPGLLFLADIHLFGASNRFLSSIGIALLIGVATFWTVRIVNDRELDRPSKAMAIALAWASIFWLGNGRILAHGNESLHVGLVLAGLGVAVHSLLRARRAQERGPTGSRWHAHFLFAAVGCVVATFSFGLGFLAWPIAIVLALRLQLPRRGIALLAVGLLSSLLVIVTGERPALESTAGDAVRSLVDAATWLGAPLFHMLKGSPMVDRSWMLTILCPTAGAGGLLATGLLSLHALWRRKTALSGLAAWCFAIVWLVGAGALVVALVRADYFAVLPEQLVAPRYLPWPCVFWAALATLVVLGMERSKSGREMALWLWTIGVAGLPLLLLPRHDGQHLEFAKYKLQRAAVGLALGVESDDVSNTLFRRPEVVQRLAGELKARRLAMFSWPESQRIGKPLTRFYRITPGAGMRVRLHLSPVQERTGRTSLEVSGTFLGDPRGTSRILIVDQYGRINGFALIGGRGHRCARRSGLLLNTPPRLFGYAVGHRIGTRYELFGVSGDGRTASPIPILESREQATVAGSL